MMQKESHMHVLYINKFNEILFRFMDMPMCFMLSWAVKYFELLLQLIFFRNDEPNENYTNVSFFGLINRDDFTHPASN